jgi:hypothetical protein
LPVDPRRDDEGDRAEEVRDQIAHCRRRRDPEVQQGESAHVQRSADELGDDLDPHRGVP